MERITNPDSGSHRRIGNNYSINEKEIEHNT